ncbi:MAG: hypothetical protein ACRDPO_02295, partial [Streptosporangiaceae bacterium]
MVTAEIHDPLPEAIVRRRQHVEAVRAQSLLETGLDGRTALAWDWALTGTRPSPVTLSLAPVRPPTRDEILREATASAEGSTAPSGVPVDYCDQLAEARRVLAWLVGATDEIPVDRENRGQLIGARDDYARTDSEISQMRDHTRRGIEDRESPDTMHLVGSCRSDPQDTSRLSVAWLQGVRDLLDWVLGDRRDSPLCHRTVGLPTAYELTYEESAATDAEMQGRLGVVDAAIHRSPQYAQALKATIRWLRGESAVPPVDHADSDEHDP